MPAPKRAAEARAGDDPRAAAADPRSPDDAGAPDGESGAAEEAARRAHERAIDLFTKMLQLFSGRTHQRSVNRFQLREQALLFSRITSVAGANRLLLTSSCQQ